MIDHYIMLSMLLGMPARRRSADRHAGKRDKKTGRQDGSETIQLASRCRGWLIGALALLAALDAAAWERVRESAPERYTVVAGDTLWDIATRFLHAPWQWPELWQANPAIDNPHLIYPGDVLTLSDCQGAPCLSLEREQRVVKLTPEMRTVPRREAISPIDPSVIEPFLRGHRIVDGDPAGDALAYVVAGHQGRLISGAGDSLYVRGQVPRDTRVGIYRPAERYVVGDGTPLGTELIKIGEARALRTEDDIVQMQVLSAEQKYAITIWCCRWKRRDSSIIWCRVRLATRFPGRLLACRAACGLSAGCRW